MVDVRRFASRIGIFFILALGSAAAQFIGYTSAQSATSTPFNGSTCTAALAASDVLVTNIGQGGHFLTAVGGGSAPTSLAFTIQGSYDGVTFFDISDVGTGPVNGSDITSVSGTGYYPVVAAKVSACVPASATFTLRYSGISLTPGTPVGVAQNGQLVKHISGGAANASFSTNALRSPFGSAAGALTFVYTSVSGPAGSTLQINCNSNVLGSGPVIFGPVTLQTTLGLSQVFPVGAFACPLFTVAYTTGGASTAGYALDYAFSEPGSAPAPYLYTHITTTTATVVKGTSPAFLHALNINTSAAGTISIFDLATAACTGTPATNVVAVITAPAATNALPTNLYDLNFLNGICVKASVAMDFTVSAQ